MQPTSPPVNDHLVELLALADACRRSGASRVSAIVPVFGYGRADKRNGKREPIMARVVADLLQVKGRPGGGQWGGRALFLLRSRWRGHAYGLMTHLNLSKSCEDEVISQLVELQRRAAEYVRRDGRLAEDEVFYAEQNARLVNAEAYYRSMFLEEVSSWNLRDRHMAETLDALASHLSRTGHNAKVAVCTLISATRARRTWGGAAS